MKYSVRDLSLLIEREKVFVLGLSNAVGRRITSQAAEVLQTVFQRVSEWYCKFVSDPVNLVVNLKRQPRTWKKKLLSHGTPTQAATFPLPFILQANIVSSAKKTPQ